MSAYASKQSMETTLTRMFDLMQNDAEFREGTKKARLTVSFEITDLDLLFLLSFDHGVITANLAAAPDEAEAELSMTSDAYDRMFSGTLVPLQAALNGELAFSGNVAAAMGLQGILPAMIRAYKAAKF
jgi:putative sterol carrier protein